MLHMAHAEFNVVHRKVLHSILSLASWLLQGTFFQGCQKGIFVLKQNTSRELQGMFTECCSVFFTE